MTDVLPITLTEIFAGKEEETAEKHGIENMLQNTLGYAEQNMDYKLKRYKKVGSIAGGIVFGLPIVAILFLVCGLMLFFLIAPEAYVTETLAFALLAVVFYNIRFGVPLFLAYILIVWRYSYLLEGKIARYIKQGIFIAGISVILLWVYESIKIILYNQLQ